MTTCARFAEALAPHLPAMPSVRSEAASSYLTTEEVAELLRSTPQRVRNLVYEGELPRVKEGARNLYRRADVEAYLSRDADLPLTSRPLRGEPSR